MFSGILSLMSGALLLFAQLPAGTNYKLQSYGVGSGGTANSTSTNYAMEGITGETSGLEMSGTAYKTGGGYIYTQQSNVPPAPALTNPSNWYNKLKLVVSNGANPTDAKFAVAISTDNFTTTRYVQSDFTVGNSLGVEDYLTHAGWGGASGITIVGLAPNTEYKVKVRATQGKFTESGYGPLATASTVNAVLTFDLDISTTDSETAPPYSMAFGSLLPGTVANISEKIWLDFDTNAEAGGDIYVYGKNAGLTSAAVSHTLASASGDLAVLSQGYGAQSASAAQATGGPLSAQSPYNVTSDNVGLLDTNIRKVYASSAPMTGGRASLLLKAKATSTTPSAADYSDVLTFVAVPGF